MTIPKMSPDEYDHDHVDYMFSKMMETNDPKISLEWMIHPSVKGTAHQKHAAHLALREIVSLRAKIKELETQLSKGATNV